ncbi:MAG: hypothetical protein HY606_11105 [Planctomycetes bacterium]|nr:hypothetical protein [Planctomycetota bacterium]
MAITFDAVDYHRLGLILKQSGWREFFRKGPNREPLYPFIISLSLRAGDFFSLDYQNIQKAVQIGILAIAQIFLFITLKKCDTHRRILLATVLYFGFSPALINSAFSLFSEIVTYPIVLGIVWISVYSWGVLVGGNLQKSIWMGSVFGIIFLLATFAKGVFDPIFHIFLFLYTALAVLMVKKDKKVVARSIVFIMISYLIYSLPMVCYKSMNRKYNGMYEYTNRYDWMLYVNAAKRVQPLTKKVLLAHIASIPGDGFCRMFFSEDECKYCEFQSTDKFSGEFGGILHGIPAHEVKKESFRIIFEKVLSNPFQYLLFMMIESAQMFFWESTQIGYVIYPSHLQWLFDLVPFKNSLRLVMSLLSIASYFFIFVYIFKRKEFLFRQESHAMHFRIVFSFFSVMLITVFVLLYSLFTNLTRYAFPIVPLYLVNIAIWGDYL